MSDHLLPRSLPSEDVQQALETHAELGLDTVDSSTKRPRCEAVDALDEQGRSRLHWASQDGDAALVLRLRIG